MRIVVDEDDLTAMEGWVQGPGESSFQDVKDVRRRALLGSWSRDPQIFVRNYGQSDQSFWSCCDMTLVVKGVMEER